MEIYQLKVFLQVARYLSFTEAASELNLTQPAVSAKIKSLEASLGTELFHRLGRKIELTATGNYLREVGPSLIELEGRLIEGIEDIKREKYSRLKVGCTRNIASSWLPRILFDYRQQYPDIDLQCLPFETGLQVHEAIASETVDVGFVEGMSAEFDAVKTVCVDSFQYRLIVATDHRLAGREWLSLRELTAEAWVFPAITTPDGKALAARLKELGLSFSDFPNHEVVDSPSLMSPFLSQGHYLGFASSFQFQAEQRAKLVSAIALQEFPLNFELLMMTRKAIQKRNFAAKGVSLKGASSEKSLGQLVQLIQERTNYSNQNHDNQKKTLSLGRSAATTAVSLSEENYAAPSKSCSKSHLKSRSKSGVKFGSEPSRLSAAKESRSSSEPETLKIAIGTQNKTIQTVTAGLIIQRLGLLEHYLPRTGRYRNVDYEICWRDFTSGAPIVSGLQSEQLDIGILGDYPLLLSGLSADGGVSEGGSGQTRLVSFVASNPDGAGNTVIVPNRSALKGLDDLRHRVIAVPFASAAHGMITRTLARANLLPEVTLTSIDDLSIHRLTPRNSQADGYAYFAPLHDIASHQGQFRRLLESDEERLPTFHGVVVSTRLAEMHPDVVIAYLKALIAAQYWYETTPSALTLVSHWVGLDEEIVVKTLSERLLGSGSNAMGLFFPDTRIRTDWVEAHIQQLSAIEGNETLGDLNLGTWIQPELLELAIAGM
ncbi:MAG: LysR substrate-binding domain-containing protein [Cyanobacteria bacterium P01_D01_bin.105]